MIHAQPRNGGGVGLKAAGVLAQSAVAASVTNTLTETTLATITIPAGSVNANGGSVRVRAWFSYTNSADNKTMSVKIGGQTVRTAGRTTQLLQGFVVDFINRGALNSQMYAIPSDGTAPGLATAAVDMSAAQNVTLTGQIGANATANTITLEGYTVEILNP